MRSIKKYPLSHRKTPFTFPTQKWYCLLEKNGKKGRPTISSFDPKTRKGWIAWKPKKKTYLAPMEYWEWPMINGYLVGSPQRKAW